MTSRLITIREIGDERGLLGIIEDGSNALPFALKRVFWIHGVPRGSVRGLHAHHTCAEVLIPLHGSLTAHVHDGHRAADFRLERTDCGLYIPAMTWCSFTDFTPDCVCLCLASEAYRKEGYINSFEEYLRIVTARETDLRAPEAAHP